MKPAPSGAGLFSVPVKNAASGCGHSEKHMVLGGAAQKTPALAADMMEITYC
jgi:hypothetical protein